MEQGPEELSENPDERAEELRRLTEEPLPKEETDSDEKVDGDSPLSKIDPGLSRGLAGRSARRVRIAGNAGASLALDRLALRSPSCSFPATSSIRK